MEFKVLFMLVRDVSSIELPCMVTNLLLSQSTGKLESYLLSVVDQERRVQSQVKRALTRRNLASMWTPPCRFSVWKISKRELKVQ